MAKTAIGKKVNQLVEQADKLVSDVKIDASKLVKALKELKDMISGDDGPKPA